MLDVVRHKMISFPMLLYEGCKCTISLSHFGGTGGLLSDQGCFQFRVLGNALEKEMQVE